MATHERNKGQPPAAAKRSALGRGLAALIPTGQGSAAKGFTTIPLDEVEPDPHQPRRYWNPKGLEELTRSVKEKGILQPVLVRKVGEGKYRIVAGERRFRAAKEAGLTRLPVIVREVTAADAFELALIENIQREDLNPVEEAEAFARLQTDHGLTQDALAQRIGKERSTVGNALRLLKLPAEVQAHVASGEVTAAHAKLLLGLDDPARQVQLAQSVVDRGWSVKELERILGRAAEGDGKPKKETPAPPPKVASLVRRLEKKVGNAVDVRVRKSGAGEVVVRFSDEDEARKLLEALLG